MAQYGIDFSTVKALALAGSNDATTALTTAAQVTEDYALMAKTLDPLLITWQAFDNNADLSALTADLLASIDGTNFFKIDSMALADTFSAGAASGWVTHVGELRFLSSKPIKFLRVKLNTITGTSVTFKVLVV